MLILGIVLGAVAYLQVGYHVIGKPSWHVWKRRKSRGLLPALLFPGSASDGDVGDNSKVAGSPMLVYMYADDERGYSTVMAFVWPGKLAVNLIIACFIATCYSIYGVYRGVVWLG